MKLLKIYILGLLIAASPITVANEVVYSPTEFLTAINKALVLPQPIYTTPIPAIVIVDVKHKKILNAEETTRLINSELASEKKLPELPMFINHISKFNNAEVNKMVLAKSSDYFILFNNPHKYQIVMMEKMLKVNMQTTIESVGRAISKLDAYVVYNAQGFTSSYFN